MKEEMREKNHALILQDRPAPLVLNPKSEAAPSAWHGGRRAQPPAPCPRRQRLGPRTLTRLLGLVRPCARDAAALQAEGGVHFARGSCCFLYLLHMSFNQLQGNLLADPRKLLCARVRTGQRPGFAQINICFNKNHQETQHISVSHVETFLGTLSFLSQQNMRPNEIIMYSREMSLCLAYMPQYLVI